MSLKIWTYRLPFVEQDIFHLKDINDQAECNNADLQKDGESNVRKTNSLQQKQTNKRTVRAT